MFRHIGLLTTRELNQQTKDALDQVQEGARFLVVRRGRPIATLGPPTREAVEAYVLANSGEFAESLARAEQDIEKGNVSVYSGENVLLYEEEDEVAQSTASH